SSDLYPRERSLSITPSRQLRPQSGAASIGPDRKTSIIAPPPVPTSFPFSSNLVDERLHHALLILEQPVHPLIDGAVSDQMVIAYAPGLAGSVHPAAALVVVAQAKAEAVVNTVARPAQIDSGFARPDLHCDHASRPALSDLLLFPLQDLLALAADFIERPPDVPAYGFNHAGVVVESVRSEEHTSELQSRENLVCRLLLEKKKT